MRLHMQQSLQVNFTHTHRTLTAEEEAEIVAGEEDGAGVLEALLACKETASLVLQKIKETEFEYAHACIFAYVCMYACEYLQLSQYEYVC